MSTATQVLDSSRVYLNDTAQDLYTDSVLLPVLKLANKELADKCAVFGIEIIREATSSPISVAALAVTLTLPNDFFYPINLWERNAGGSEAEWAPMAERMWEPTGVVQTSTLNYWSYRRDIIYFIGATTDKEVKLQYQRVLPDLDDAGDVIDTEKFYRFLAATTAEIAARFIGTNKLRADEIKNEASLPASDDLARMLVLNGQGIRQRRQQFTVKRNSYIIT